MSGLTAVEAYIDEQVGPHLAPGESISHRAYLRVSSGAKRDPSLIRTNAAITFGLVGGKSASKRMKSNRAYFLALTPGRLFLIETRPGTLGPKLANHWMAPYAPADVRISVAADGLHLDTRDGQSLVLEIDLTTKYSATQPALMTLLGVR